MKYEPCESKVANLLAALDEVNVPSEKIRLLVECVAEQEKEVQDVKNRYLVLAKAHNELLDALEYTYIPHEKFLGLRIVVPEETK